MRSAVKCYYFTNSTILLTGLSVNFQVVFQNFANFPIFSKNICNSHSKTHKWLKSVVLEQSRNMFLYSHSVCYQSNKIITFHVQYFQATVYPHYVLSSPHISALFRMMSCVIKSKVLLKERYSLLTVFPFWLKQFILQRKGTNLANKYLLHVH